MQEEVVGHLETPAENHILQTRAATLKLLAGGHSYITVGLQYGQLVIY